MACGEKAAFKCADDGQLLVTALSKFALQLYKEQVKEKSSGNAFMSPLSISAVLNMTLLGARGKTLAEMKTTLCLDRLKDDSKLHQAFSDLISHLKKCSTHVPKYFKAPLFQLHMVNRIYAEESYKILSEFKTSCKKYYDAAPLSASFVRPGDPEKATAKINSWVLEQTKEKIKDLIPPGFINECTVLILINVIYFKSTWHHTFKKENTKDDDFFASPTETLKVKMMYQKIENVSYYQSSDLLCQVLQLPYMNKALSMFILLPDKASTLDAVEERLTADHLQNIDGGFQEIFDVKLWLPKFKIEETLELSEVLSRMGMKSLFTPSAADLSGVDGTRKLYSSKVVHKAFVDVNEEGTEAAAATAMDMRLRCAGMHKEIVDFRADHPFMFFIREERTKAILFIGRVVRPKYPK